MNSFVLLPTDEEEVIQIINSLKDQCCTGFDKIPNKFLKEQKKLLAPPLTHIFNKCLEQGVFPSVLKTAQIIPIHKGGDRNHIINYRTISILPSLCKISEKIINKRLTKYLEENHIFPENQYGFRSGLSTDDAVHTLTDNVSTQLDEGKKCIEIFLDLAKAFDTVSVPILLQKLHAIGVRGDQLKLFNLID